MNNTRIATVDEAQELSDNKARLLIPATVFIAVLMVSGFVGNIVVCFYYALKSRKTTNSFFIVILAVYDLISCSICMPGEIVDIAKFYTFENGEACKVLRFLNYFTVAGSVVTLMVIAVDRYKKINNPTSKQMTKKQARWISLAVGIFAVIVSLPSLLLQGAIQVNIQNEAGLNITGHDCTVTKDKSLQMYVLAYNLVLLAIFFIVFIVLICLYGIIGKTIYEHRRNLLKHKRETKKAINADILKLDNVPIASTVTMDSSASDTSGDMQSKPKHVNTKVRKPKELDSEADTSGDLPSKPKHANTKENKPKVLDSASDTSGEMRSKPKHANIKERKRNVLGNESVNITLVMLAITAAFILSFLPHVSLQIWMSLGGKHTDEILSDSDLVGYTIGTLSYLLNSGINPWIYGIFNSSFRNFICNKIRCK